MIHAEVRRDSRDIAAPVLLDESYSTDAWITDGRARYHHGNQIILLLTDGRPCDYYIDFAGGS